MTTNDKLLSIEEVKHAISISDKNTLSWHLATQLAGTMRELEYYKKLCMNLSTGTAQPSMGNARNYESYPHKDLK